MSAVETYRELCRAAEERARRPRAFDQAAAFFSRALSEARPAPGVVAVVVLFDERSGRCVELLDPCDGAMGRAPEMLRYAATQLEQHRRGMPRPGAA